MHIPRPTSPEGTTARHTGDVASRAAAAGLPLTVPLSWGGLAVDLARYVVTLNNEPLALSARQVDLVALFVGAPERVWSREQLHQLCWDAGPVSRAVDTELYRLRAKIGSDLLLHARGEGWALRTTLQRRSPHGGSTELTGAGRR